MNKVEPQASQQMIDLSIVIISYNTIDFTRACLDSVISRLGKLTAEIIVVDNASMDGSAEMVKELFPSVRLIPNNKNVGFAAANNQAFLLAQGDFVLLLNSDTVVLGDVLPNSVDYLRAHSQVGAIGCRVLNTDRSMQRTCSGYPSLLRLLIMTLGLDRLPINNALDSYQLRNWQRDTDREVEVISGCYLLVRRSIIESVGPMDDSFFFFGEETDWCIRMRRAGWKLRFAPVGEIIHHGGGSVKKLNYRRDVMLAEATIRLHKKNSGKTAAAVAFMILAMFILSRALAWTACSLVRPACRARAAYFRKILAHTFETWPKERA